MTTQREIIWLYGPYSQLGYTIMVLTLAFDQAHKWWMLLIYRIEEKGPVVVTPFLDLVLRQEHRASATACCCRTASRASGCWRDLRYWRRWPWPSGWRAASRTSWWR